MTSEVKNALITTATVLATLFVLNMFAPTQKIVQRAVNGS